MRFDDAEKVLPDFVHLDIDQARGTPMEVFGRTDPEYRIRATEKRQHYDRAYGPGVLWSWDATIGESWPAFPPASERG